MSKRGVSRIRSKVTGLIDERRLPTQEEMAKATRLVGREVQTRRREITSLLAINDGTKFGPRNAQDTRTDTKLASEPSKELPPRRNFIIQALDFPQSSSIGIHFGEARKNLVRASALVSVHSINGKQVSSADELHLGPGWYLSKSLDTYYQYVPTSEVGESVVLKPLYFEKPVSSLVLEVWTWTDRYLEWRDLGEGVKLELRPVNAGPIDTCSIIFPFERPNK